MKGSLQLIKYFLPLSLAGIGCNYCKDVVVRSESSTENVATVSQKDCGAMGRGGSTLVSVRYLNTPDNNTHGVVIFGVRGQKKIEIKWTDARTLFVRCILCSDYEVNFRAVKSGEVVIDYDIVPNSR